MKRSKNFVLRSISVVILIILILLLLHTCSSISHKNNSSSPLSKQKVNITPVATPTTQHQPPTLATGSNIAQPSFTQKLANPIINSAPAPSSPVSAASLISLTENSNSTRTSAWQSGWYLGLQAGLMSIHIDSNDAMQVAPIGYPLDQFTTQYTGNGVLYGIEGGYVFNLLHSSWLPQYRLGLRLLQTNNLTIQGDHTFDYSLADIHDSYQYQYKLNILLVGVDGSIDIYHWQYFAPFVGMGFDVARLQTQAFNETIASSATQDAPWTFAGHTTQLATYDVEAGIRYQPLPHWQLQASYMYLPLGTVVTGAGDTGVVTTPGISSQLNSNNFILAAYYQF